MSNVPKEPSEEVLEYIRSKYSYRDGMIDSINNLDVGSVHYRGKEKKPYKRICFEKNCQKYKVYRSHMVWFLCKGFWPYMEIDHIDRDTLNDKIDNLIQATHMEQQRNKDNYKYVLS